MDEGQGRAGISGRILLQILKASQGSFISFSEIPAPAPAWRGSSTPKKPESLQPDWGTLIDPNDRFRGGNLRAGDSQSIPKGCGPLKPPLCQCFSLCLTKTPSDHFQSHGKVFRENERSATYTRLLSFWFF